MKKLLLLFAFFGTFALVNVNAQKSCSYAKYLSKCSKKSADKVADQDMDSYEAEGKFVNASPNAKKKSCIKSASSCLKYKSAKMVSNEDKAEPSIAQKAACLQACAKTKETKAKAKFAKLDGV